MRKIHKLVAAFSQLEGAHVGRGPDHPDRPNSMLENAARLYFNTHPYLMQDNAYVTFTRTYAGAYLYRPDQERYVEILGFSHMNASKSDSGQILAWDSDDAITQHGFFIFCMVKMRSGKMVREFAFGFDATGSQDEGIYYINGDQFEWYCQTFIEWLQILVQTKGVFSGTAV